MMKLDIVIPFYNEAQCAKAFVEQLLIAFPRNSLYTHSLFLVDDGSTDGTAEILDDLSRTDDHIHVIHLWGNHGHQKALVAGMDQSNGDALLLMDGDGQHPVHVVVSMVEALCRNPDAEVIQAVRKGRQGGWIKNLSSAFFYWSVNKLMPDAKLRRGASDFRVMRKSAVELLKRYPDRHRNLRVLLASLNLATVYVEYEVAPRIAGVSHYRFRQMLALAMDGWFAFSSSPLRVSLLLMCGSGIVGLAYLIYGLVVYVQDKTVPGWTSIIALVAFFFSAVFGVLAIMSEYVARIYADVRRHPVYRLRPDSSPTAGPADKRPGRLP